MDGTPDDPRPDGPDEDLASRLWRKLRELLGSLEDALAPRPEPVPAPVRARPPFGREP